MLKNNCLPLFILFPFKTKEYSCTYWGYNRDRNKKYFLISSLICFVFLLSYLSIYCSVFFININNPEINYNKDIPEIIMKIVLTAVNLIFTFIAFYLYFYKYNLNNRTVNIFNSCFLLCQFFTIIVLYAFSASIFDYSFSQQFKPWVLILYILYIISQFYMSYITNWIQIINKYANFYDSSKWNVSFVNEQKLDEYKSRDDYYWKINENISLEHNITFKGLVYFKKAPILKDAVFLFEYNSKIYSITFCGDLYFVLTNKDKEKVNNDVANLILFREKN